MLWKQGVRSIRTTSPATAIGYPTMEVDRVFRDKVVQR